MRLGLPKRHRHDYLADMHLYVDDLKELHELRNQAKGIGNNLDEVLFYSRLIEGAQRVLEFLQQETMDGK
jgi:hypothetical protein